MAMTLVVAHRARGFGFPANSQAAFAAVPRRFGVETDIWMTRDGVAVIHHDAHITVAGKRRRLTSLYSRSVPKHLPRLTDALPTLQRLRWLNLEIKPSRARFGPLIPLLQDCDCCISSFSTSVLRRLRRSLPEARLARLAAAGESPGHVVRVARELGAEAVHLQIEALDARWVRALKQADLTLRVYTANRISQWQLAIESGAAAIMTDRPKALAAWLDNGSRT